MWKWDRWMSWFTSILLQNPANSNPPLQASRLPISATLLQYAAMNSAAPIVAVIMGSKSDWKTMKHAVEMLEDFEVPVESRVVSAHRTPSLMADFARDAAGRGIQVIIAGAGGAAHLPGMIAAQTELPVLGVPVESRVLKGVDSLLSIVQMPAGIPVATFAIGVAGAKNAALFAVSILALRDEKIRLALNAFREKQTASVLASVLP